MDYVNAFWVGGLICALVQILLDKTKLLPGRVMVLAGAVPVLYSGRSESMNRLPNLLVREQLCRCLDLEIRCGKE